MNLKIEKHLLHIFKDEKALILLQKQLAKDFAFSQIEFPTDFEEHVYELEKLFKLIEEKLVQILEKGERQTLQLLYTIDIPEKKFLSLLGTENIARSLTQLILEREAQKIYFRLKYS